MLTPEGCEWLTKLLRTRPELGRMVQEDKMKRRIYCAWRMKPTCREWKADRRPANRQTLYPVSGLAKE